MKRVALLVVVPLVLAAAAFGGNGGPGVYPPPKDGADSLERLEMHAMGGAATVAKKKKPKITTFSSDVLPVAAFDSVGGRMDCPRKSKAIDGGFGSDGFIVPDLLGPVGAKAYGFRVFDLAGAPGEVVFTLTCSKNNG